MSDFKEIMSSKTVVSVVKAGATVFLAITLLAAGFAVCLLPQTTEIMATKTVNTNYSVFSKESLVKGAEATRDYSFVGHDKHALLTTIYIMNQDFLNSGGKYSKQDAAPSINQNIDANTLSTIELETALYPANEKYALNAVAVAHLDDVYNVAIFAYPLLIVIVLLCVASFAHIVFYRGWKGAALPLITGSGVLIMLFLILGVWSLIDFYSMFNFLHSFLFSNGSWLFSYDSLLICMLPQDFWMGLGAIWLIVTGALSILCLIIGFGIRLRCKS